MNAESRGGQTLQRKTCGSVTFHDGQRPVGGSGSGSRTGQKCVVTWREWVNRTRIGRKIRVRLWGIPGKTPVPSVPGGNYLKRGFERTIW